MLAPSCIGAALGSLTGHVLGPLLGASAFVALSRMLWTRAGETPFPRSFSYIYQSLAGILLGARITPDIGALLLSRALPLAGAVLYVLAAGFVIALVLHRRYGWHGGLAWLSAAPGRSGDMLAIAQDINLSGKERLALVSVHTVRQVYFTLFVSTLTVFI